MTRNLMNPLNLDSKRFVVAVDPMNDNQIYGWAQFRPTGFNLQNAQEYDALPGSGSIESDIDDEIWQDFEDDPADFPNSAASLPWTKEYKEFSKASSKRREKRMQLMDRAEMQRIRGQNQLWELASVFVKPKWRNRGIGRELIQRVMAKHAMVERSSRDVYLLTLDSTQDWYRSLGFELTDEPPATMAGEITVGNLITGLVGSKLVCMKGGSVRR
jgi:ribosomal protein S18 acetylase RimI-like enzyme